MPDRTWIPNAVTLARLLSVPVLWGFALAGREVVVGLGFFFAWTTDALDGFLARLLDARSSWGSRLDTVADTLVMASGIAWVAMLRPEFVRDHAVALGTWIAIGAAAYATGWIRFRRFADLHLYSAKAANFAGFIFVANLLVFDWYPPAVFYPVIALLVLAAAETLMVFATFDRVDEHVVTIFRKKPLRKVPRGPP
jgi:phosphatidylglycerophosphate synthase